MSGLFLRLILRETRTRFGKLCHPPGQHFAEPRLFLLMLHKTRFQRSL